MRPSGCKFACTINRAYEQVGSAVPLLPCRTFGDAMGCNQRPGCYCSAVHRPPQLVSLQTAVRLVSRLIITPTPRTLFSHTPHIIVLVTSQQATEILHAV
jgi:hypothetical protein